jgi:type II restriction enzyme
MKYQSVFKEKIDCDSPEDVFAYLINKLKKTITSWDYFVNWKKVHENEDVLAKNLNLLNDLIGKDDIKVAAIQLLKEYPQVISTIPMLLAIREGKANFNLLKDYKNGPFVYEGYDLRPSGKISAEKAVEFMDNSGLLEELFQSKRITSLMDYAIGVEVGLSSNGRKNRGGKNMEDIIEFFVKDICKRNDYEYLNQASPLKIREKWGKSVTVNKSSKRFDFAINTPKKLIIIEVNFFSSGGSKLKSVAGEFIKHYDSLSKDGHQFIWLTDGDGWNTSKKPLEETFNHIDYILNLSMIENGILEALLS